MCFWWAFVAGHGYKVHLPVARQRHGNSDWTTLTDSIHTTVPVGSSIAISSRHSPRNGSERPRTGELLRENDVFDLGEEVMIP